MSDEYLGALLGQDKLEQTIKALKEIGRIMVDLGQNQDIAIDSIAPTEFAKIAGLGVVYHYVFDVGLVTHDNIGNTIEIDFKINVRDGSILQSPFTVTSSS